MDPTSNYAQQVWLAYSMQDCSDGGHSVKQCTCLIDADRLVELVLALNAWISRGGFPPDQMRTREG
jgi:hypothetical protein